MNEKLFSLSICDIVKKLFSLQYVILSIIHVQTIVNRILLQTFRCMSEQINNTNYETKGQTGSNSTYTKFIPQVVTTK